MDYGNCGDVEREKVMVLEEMFRKDPPFAFPVKLTLEGYRDNEETRQKMMEIFQGGNISMNLGLSSGVHVF